MKNKYLCSFLGNVLGSNNYPKNVLEKYLEENFNEVEKLYTQHIFNIRNDAMDELLGDTYENLDEFRQRLFETWEAPLKRLDTLLFMCTEIADQTNRTHRHDQKNITSKTNIITRLHARALQVGSEICHLISGGFADGALARWRTLHETTIILKFICEGDEDLATRFTDFQDIHRFKQATRYNKNNELEFDDFSTEEISEFENKQKIALEKHGPDFCKDYGWARKALGAKPKDSVKLMDIEAFVGLSFFRNHYAFANQYVHAGIDSIGYKLGTSMSNHDLLLTGPSNEGLIEPIQCTSFSLVHATVALISALPDEEGLLEIPFLRLWHEVLKGEVLVASDDLQKKGDALRS